MGSIVAAGMNSVGIMSSAGIGRVLADWIVDGVQPVDLWDIDIARVDPLDGFAGEHMQERMKEAVSDLFACIGPSSNPRLGAICASRRCMSSGRSKALSSALTAGWERGLWYARKRARSATCPIRSVNKPGNAIAEREAAMMQKGTAALSTSHPSPRLMWKDPMPSHLLQPACLAPTSMCRRAAPSTRLSSTTGAASKPM